MAEYIDKAEIIADLDDTLMSGAALLDRDLRVIKIIRIFKLMINDFPAADVQPVVHGRWEYIRNVKLSGTIKLCECSICHNKVFGGLNYCGNCGARMIKDGDAE